MRRYTLLCCMVMSLLACACARPQPVWHSAPLQIEVVASGTEAVLAAFIPAPDGRMEVLRAQGFVGRGGVSSAKVEGDGKTPLGVFAVERAFGLADNPGARVPYTRVTALDVWVDDPASAYYNQWARGDAPDKDWTSAEKLASETVAYEYAAVIEYNTDRPVKGAGSAIFLHCVKEGPTAGCVSVPQGDMRKLLLLLRPGARIAIASSPEELRAITGAP